MFNKQKVVVVMPAYNAAKTLQITYDEVMAQSLVDLIILVDDASSDQTVSIARTMDKVKVHIHEKNMGYGANQKSCYRLALEEGAEIVIMVHPDYQYTPMLIPAMVSMIGNGLYDCVLGSRILGGYALRCTRRGCRRGITGFAWAPVGSSKAPSHGHCSHWDFDLTLCVFDVMKQAPPAVSC